MSDPAPPRRRATLTVYGATGFTGRRVCLQLVRRLPQLLPELSALQATSSSSAASGFSWQIAGRRREALESLRRELVEASRSDVVPAPEVVVASNDSYDSLASMCRGTRLVMNCAGPYDLLGEDVVRATIEASEALVEAGEDATDHIDLTGEPGWAERMVLKYYERAKSAGCTILHYAAFDSVPADLGVLLAKRELLLRRGAASASSVEVFFRIKLLEGGALRFHYGTWASAVNGLSHVRRLAETRSRLYGSKRGGGGGGMLPRPRPEASQRGMGVGLARRGRFGGLVNWAPEVQSYLLPFFFADPSVIRLSQSLAAHQAASTTADYETSAVALACWVQVPSLPVVLLAALGLAIFAALCRYSWGRGLLLRHPKVFSLGLFSHEGPTEEQMRGTGFETTIVARGHSAALLKSGAAGAGPDVRVTVRVSGAEPGYVATPALFVSVAETILLDRAATAAGPTKAGGKVRRGVLTPAVALGLETGLVERINAEGSVRFETL